MSGSVLCLCCLQNASCGMTSVDFCFWDWAFDFSASLLPCPPSKIIRMASISDILLAFLSTRLVEMFPSRKYLYFFMEVEIRRSVGNTLRQLVVESQGISASEDALSPSNHLLLYTLHPSLILPVWHWSSF